MLKLKLWYSGHLMQRADSLEKTLCWERLRARGDGEDRGWDGWIASPTRWTWVWVNSRSWWWTGRPGVLRFMGSQRVGHDWVTELNWLNWMALWRTVWDLPYDSSIPLLGMYLEKIILQKDTWTSVFISELLTIAKTWKQPECPSTDSWIKMWSVRIQWNIIQP